MRIYTEKDLPVLTLILDRDPELAKVLEIRFSAVEAALEGPRLSPVTAVVGAGEPPVQAPQEQEQPITSASLDDRILDWFKSKPKGSRQKLPDVRKDLGIAPDSKSFKTAIHRLIEAKILKSNNTRGRGAEYWT